MTLVLGPPCVCIPKRQRPTIEPTEIRPTRAGRSCATRKAAVRRTQADKIANLFVADGVFHFDSRVVWTRSPDQPVEYGILHVANAVALVKVMLAGDVRNDPKHGGPAARLVLDIGKQG